MTKPKGIGDEAKADQQVLSGLVAIIPKLRTPLHLAAFAVLVTGLVLVFAFQVEMVPIAFLAGPVAIILVVAAQLPWRDIFIQIPVRTRSAIALLVVVTACVAIIIFAFGAIRLAEKSLAKPSLGPSPASGLQPTTSSERANERNTRTSGTLPPVSGTLSAWFLPPSVPGARTARTLTDRDDFSAIERGQTVQADCQVLLPVDAADVHAEADWFPDRQELNDRDFQARKAGPDRTDQAWRATGSFKNTHGLGGPRFNASFILSVSFTVPGPSVQPPEVRAVLGTFAVSTEPFSMAIPTDRGELKRLVLLVTGGTEQTIDLVASGRSFTTDDRKLMVRVEPNVVVLTRH